MLDLDITVIDVRAAIAHAGAYGTGLQSVSWKLPELDDANLQNLAFARFTEFVNAQSEVDGDALPMNLILGPFPPETANLANKYRQCLRNQKRAFSVFLYTQS